MSAWRGLTRPEQHRVTPIQDMAYCVVCEVCCWRIEPCRCCLAAEDRLTAALAEREVCPATNTLLGNPIVCDRWMPEMTCRMEIGAYRCIEHVGSFMAYPDQACERARINSALRVLDTSQTDIAAELERAVRAEAAIARVWAAPIEVVEGLLKRAEQAEAAIARVLEWHAEHCDECNDTGPCQTIRAIEGGAE